jgi:hypothetical protein
VQEVKLEGTMYARVVTIRELHLHYTNTERGSKIEITLIVIYLSLATYQSHYKIYTYPSEKVCSSSFQKMKRRVRVGRIWGFCRKL